MAFRELARSTGLYDVVEPAYSRLQVAQWGRTGNAVPAPSAVKRQLLVAYARRYGLRTLIETGTYRADTVRALRGDFEQIYSIELSPELHRKAVARCRGQENATILLGDSGVVLPQLLVQLRRPALFWLDAHYSGGGTALGGAVSPIEKELDAVLSHVVQGHIVLVDDAREFYRPELTGYPPALVIEAAAARHGYELTVETDIFRLVPPR